MPNQPDRNHAIERLLREARPGTAVAADGPCVTAEELAAWLDRGLPEAESAKLEAHLAACPACQTLLGAYAATAPAVASQSRAWTRAALPFAAAAVLVVGVWMAGTRWAQQPAPGTAVERQMARLEEPSAAPVPSRSAREAGPEQTLPASPSAPAERADRRSGDLADLQSRANGPAATQERNVASVPVAIDQSAALERSTVPAAPPPVASPPAPQAGANARDSATAATADRATVSAESDRAKQELAAAAPTPARARSEGFSPATARLSVPLAKAANAPVAFSSPDGGWRWRITGAVLEVSSDSGGMWLPATGVTPVDLENVTSGASPGRGVSWLVGQGGLVLVSTDGRRFTRAVPPAAAPLTRVQAVDASTASVQAADGRAWRTVDGGRTWIRLP